MTPKELYAQLCSEHFTPLFSRPYWLEAVSKGKEWEVLLVRKNEQQPYSVENIAAALPVHVSAKWGIRRLLMPQETPQIEAFVAPDADAMAATDRLAEELERFCRKERVVVCSLQGFFSPEFCAALQRRGYQLRERQTYRLAPEADREAITRRFHENKRRQLRKAVGLHLVSLSPEAFYAFHSDCLMRQGKAISYSASFAAELLGTLTQQKAVRLLGAAREDGTLLAAVGLVEDEQTMYYLLPTYRPDYSKSGAMAWLTREAICLAGQTGKVFDFEGSMVPSIARSYREFGGQAVTYYQAEKYYNRLFEFVWETLLRK